MSAEISSNRKALRDFHISDKYEAGIELRGTEVKSIRAGKVNAIAAVLNSRVITGLITDEATAHKVAALAVRDGAANIRMVRRKQPVRET